MKIKNLMLGGALVALMASCSDDKLADAPQTPVFEGDGYISVDLNLPTVLGSRADNDVFDSGLESEYAVNNGVLLIFTGTDESDAVFEAAYDLNPVGNLWNEEVSGEDNVTTSYRKTIKIDDVTLGTDEQMFGLVMLNYKYIGSVSMTEDVVDGETVVRHNFDMTCSNVVTTKDENGNDTYQINESKLTLAKGKGQKLEVLTNSLNGKLTNFVGDERNGFFMVNAPMSTAKGNATDPAGAEFRTLVPMGSTLYPTAAAAEAADHVAASFFVERAVAKTTFNVDPALEGVDMPAPAIDGSTEKASLAFTEADVAWFVGNEEPVSFIVRNVSDNSWLSYVNAAAPASQKYRFVGSTRAGWSSIQDYMDLFRIYWCLDPSYDKNKIPVDDTKKAFITKFGLNNPVYTHENTFDVAHQNHQNTTRVMVRIQLNGGRDFWTINDDQRVIYAKESDATTYMRNYILNTQEVYDAIKSSLVTYTDAKNVLENAEQYVETKFADDADGYVRCVSISFKSVAGNSAFRNGRIEWTGADDEANVRTSANKMYTIAHYAGGYNYYDLRQMHFASDSKASDLAPWNPEITSTTYTVDDSYLKFADPAQNWLGRYGLVRNNWYDITITGVTHFGKPTVSSLNVDNDPTPDDRKEVEKWISFRVNVLDWALRRQNHVL